MDGIKQRKKKRKISSSLVDERSLKSKKTMKKWNTCDVDSESLFSASVGGFMGLDELQDYNEEELKNIISSQPKKKRKKRFVENSDDEITLNDKEDNSNNSNNKEIVEDTPEGVKISSGPKELSKKARQKEKRKQSFKLLLKERRRKRKELLRKGKADNLNKEEAKEEKVVEEKNPNEVEVDSSKNVSKVIDMSDWNGLGVPDEVIKALSEKHFTCPTPIQKETLPHAIFYRKDIIGAAETGSGKTLAFGIPLLKLIMDLKEKQTRKMEKKQHTEENSNDDDDDDEKPLYALILTPTRELALQIHTHIKEASKYTNINSAVVVGGLAAPKQERLLSKCPEIVIGTPGRLHKLITNGELHLNKFDSVKFLVIDECDRMLENGHFKELDEIIDMVNNSKSKKQMFLFSATLALPQQHQHNKYNKKSKQNKDETESELQNLVNKVGINSKAKVVDLTTKHVTASMLQQLKVRCTNEEKEIYLLYFLMTHPGRTIVFVNSIALTKRLSALLMILGRDPLQLHAGKQQRQRLKYLDRFVNSDTGLLIATDVAARGLDIPKVQNVVHYQLPLDPKVYIHRAGRTARAKEDGLSFIIEGSEDFNAYKKISQVLKLGTDIPSLNVDRGYLEGMKVRVKLAKEIDKEEYKSRIANADKKWMDRVAKEMDVITDHDNESGMTKEEKLILSQKKKQLSKLLNTKLIPKGFSGAYPTRGGGLMSLETLI